jgi:hypothetical protein
LKIHGVLSTIFGMKPIFRSYPSHPWLSGWRLEPRVHGSSAGTATDGSCFRTTDIVGQLVPDNESTEWALQIPIPQNGRINMMFNGFCGYFSKAGRNCMAEVFIPEAGVVWGRFSDIPPPALITDHPLHDSGAHQWIDSDTAPALLAVRDNIFCLVTKLHIYADAEALAEHYLAEDIENRIHEELEHRSGARKLFEQMHRHDSLAAISAECMMRALRRPEGKINGIWSQSSTSATPRLNINESYPLLLAWRHIDVAVAEDLLRSILRLQTSSGAIPVQVSPHETFSTLEAPKPLLCKAAAAVWTIRKDPEFAAEIVPALRRNLQWTLHHFNPKRRGQYSWQNENEMVVPELFESELATADLAALLLTEIDAINRLRESNPRLARTPPYFEEERDTLENNLQAHFWNEASTDFSNAFIRDRQLSISGLPSFLPLLWRGLPSRKKNAALTRIKETGVLPGGLNVLSWTTSAPNERNFPVLQQQLVLETFRTADERGSITHDFARITLQGFVEWHAMSIAEQRTLHLDAATASYIINIQDTRFYRYFAQGRISGFLFKTLRKTKVDRFELSIIALTVFSILSIHTIYKVLDAPPPFEALEAEMNSAYMYQDETTVLEKGRAIIEHYPDQAAPALLYAGNMLLLRNAPQEAEKLFEIIRREYPDSPGPMISLGLACQLQGKFQDAERNYAEFCYLFDQIFPDLVAMVQEYRMLGEEGFKAPPKWPEIYRYQLMHEL